MKTADNLWFTSDTHYMHKNIVRGTTSWRNSEGEIPLESVRDFETLESMNELLVENINKNVDKADWLVHLGDWSFGGFDNIREFRDKINCKNVVLILGNHDHHIINDKDGIRKLFTHVAHYDELQITTNKHKDKLILCHYPIESWNNMHKGSYMIHGHVHSKGGQRFSAPRRMDVGVCGSEGFRPYHLEEILHFLS